MRSNRRSRSSTMLYLVPTPIGNLEDMTLRALRVLQEVDFILAEDTRTSRKLLDHYRIATPLRAHHAHNERAAAPALIHQLQAGAACALIYALGMLVVFWAPNTAGQLR